MEFGEVLRRRRMVRAYDTTPVPLPALCRALRRAVRAPSAGFTQGWDFVVLIEPSDRAVFWAAATPQAAARQPDHWLRGVCSAPCLIVVCSDPQAYVDRYSRPDKADRSPGAEADSWPVPYWDVDAGMAALLMLLSGVDDGLGGLFFGVPAGRCEHLAETLRLPVGRRIVGVVALGYPAVAAGTPDGGSRTAPHAAAGARSRYRPVRRPLGEVVHEGRFGHSPGWLLPPSDASS